MTAHANLLVALGMCMALCRSAMAADQKDLVSVTYAVADLVVPIDMDPGEKQPPVGQPFGFCPNGQNMPPGEKEPPAGTREQELMQAIRKSVAPESWSDKGGPATMQFITLGYGLMIQQTPQAHENIKKVLADLRRLQDVEVAVEVRLVRISTGMLERLDVANATKDKQGRWHFSDVQVFQFLEAAQGDRGSFNVMQAPKMTVFNGQKGTISVLDYQSFLTLKPGDPENPHVSQLGVEYVGLGQRFTVRPTVSPDLRSVKIDLGVYLANLDGQVPLVPVLMTNSNDKKVQNFVQLPQVNKIEWGQMLKFADAETIMVHLKRNPTETRNEFGPPMLSKIPYLSRLFTNTAYGRQSRLIGFAAVFLFHISANGYIKT